MAQRVESVTPIAFHRIAASDSYDVPGCSLIKGSGTTVFSQPDAFALWIASGALQAGSRLAWNDEHEESSLYVRSGRIEVDGEVCGPGSVVVIEQGGKPDLVALDESVVIHVGTTGNGDPAGGPLGMETHVNPVEPASPPRSFANGDSPTCQMVVFTVEREEPHREPSHSHSADEIIYSYLGDIQFGPILVREGDAIAIPADYRYGFQTKGPFGYINFRPTRSTSTRNANDH